MNATDATLWDIKRDPALRTTIVALALLERSPDWETLNLTVERALERLPRFRQRVVEGLFGLGRPKWVETDVDLPFHLRRVDAPASKDLQSILELCGAIAGEEFDPARPLWEMLLVNGLAGGRAALIMKVSHAVTDGIGGVALFQAFADKQSAPSAKDLSNPPRSDGGNWLSGSIDSAESVAKSLVHPLQAATSAFGLAGSAARQLRPSGAPLSALMTKRSLGRSVGVSTVSLDRLHHAAHRAGGTVNDGLVTICLGALADYHRNHGISIGDVRVTMPVSFRTTADDSASNQWTPSRFVVPLDSHAHPFELLARYQALLRKASHEPAIGISHLLAGSIQELPSGLTAGIVGGMVKGSDVVITNIPGPEQSISIGGAEVTELYPFAPTGGAALNIGLLSYDGVGYFGINMDTAAVEHPTEFLRCLEDRATDFLWRRHRPGNDIKGPQQNERQSAAVQSGRPDSKPSRLSALDTSFLRLESAKTPMHMGGLLILKGASLYRSGGQLDLNKIRNHIQAGLARTPRLLHRVEEVPLELGRPVWVSAERFDIADHVHELALPAPGSRDQLLELCEEIQMQLLDRSKPLFGFWFVTGLDPTEFGEGAVALVEKIHHALFDGASGVELLGHLFSLRPAPLQRLAPGSTNAASNGTASPGSLRLLTDAAIEQLREPMSLAKIGLDAVRSPRQSASKLAAVGSAIADVVLPPANTPPSLNRSIGSRRQLLPITVDLETVRGTAAALGGTINDVVLAAISLGFSELFSLRGEALSDAFLVLVPVSTRSRGADTQTGNHVTAVVIELPVGESDPLLVFTTVNQRSQRLKSGHHADGTELLLEASDYLPPPAVDVFTQVVKNQRMINAVVTNMPGPPRRLFLGEAEITEMIPIVPLGANVTTSVAVLSYDKNLVVALHVDAEACPDANTLATAIDIGFKKLADASDTHARVHRGPGAD